MKFGVEERGKSPGIGIIETLRERERESPYAATEKNRRENNRQIRERKNKKSQRRREEILRLCLQL